MACRLLVIVTTFLFLSPTVSYADETPWYRRCLVGMEVGPTGAHFGHNDGSDKRYAARFDGYSGPGFSGGRLRLRCARHLFPLIRSPLDWLGFFRRT